MNGKKIAGALIIGLLSAIVGSQFAVLFAQTADETDSISPTHPLVGTWRIRADETHVPALMSFSSDGTSHGVDDAGNAGLGAWTATSPNSATNTMLFQDLGTGGAARSWITIRATITVSDDGMTFSSMYTLEFSAVGNGAASGQIGPGTAEGIRVSAEAVGTPIVPLSILDAPHAGTPASSPFSQVDS